MSSFLLGGNIACSDRLRRDVPRTRYTTSWKTLEVKLAADLWVWTTCMRNIIRIKWHHVSKHVCATSRIWRWKESLLEGCTVNCSSWTLSVIKKHFFKIFYKFGSKSFRITRKSWKGLSELHVTDFNIQPHITVIRRGRNARNNFLVNFFLSC